MKHTPSEQIRIKWKRLLFELKTSMQCLFYTVLGLWLKVFKKGLNGENHKFSHGVVWVAHNASFCFLQCCIDLTKTKQSKNFLIFLILILYDENAKKTCFWFLYPRWLKSKNTIYKCVNITLGLVKDRTLTFCSIH